MPSKSKAQQRFFGMVDAYKKGEMKNASSKIKKAANGMSMSDVKDFAETKHKGLPEKVKEQAIIRLTESDLHRIVKESVKNILINEIGYGNPEEFLAPDALAAYKKRKENDNSVEDDIRVASLKAVKAARNAAFDAASAVANDTDAQKLKAAKAAFNAAIDFAIAATKSSAMMNRPHNI